MDELWQLYDNQGRPITGKGASKNDVYAQALLHAASHVWVWRWRGEEIELLFQKRAADKRTWPNRYDISAAGHIDLGEQELQAAMREVAEEIGYRPDASHLEFIGTHRCFVVAPNKTWTENEIRFLYLLEISSDIDFRLEDGEVASLEWKPLSVLRYELAEEVARDTYVPHGEVYFALLFEALERVMKNRSQRLQYNA